MEKMIKIDELASKLNITSRTLRHWEDMGLFKSHRDAYSNWRTYDLKTVELIQIIKVLREIDIPIQKVKMIINDFTIQSLLNVLESEINHIKKESFFRHLRLKTLEGLMMHLKSIEKVSFHELSLFLEQNQDEKGKERMILNKPFKMVNLKETKVVYHIHISENPEDEAMKPVLEYLKQKQLLGTTKMYGGNVKPFSSQKNKAYGYGFMATIPMDYEVEAPLKTMMLEGGLYAAIDSTDQIYESWQDLVMKVKEDNMYQSDRSRLCLEEHIFNGEDEGFSLVLYEPIKKR